MQVTFKILRGDAPKWRRVMKRLDYSSMLREVKEHAHITSKNIDVGYDDSANVGVIFADNEVAGTFSISRDVNHSPAL